MKRIGADDHGSLEANKPIRSNLLWSVSSDFPPLSRTDQSPHRVGYAETAARSRRKSPRRTDPSL